jgi:hypothetical protein
VHKEKKMPRELPDRKTPIAKEEIVVALWQAWEDYFHEIPKKESIWILSAQNALECGWGGKWMHCFNFGNVKSREGDGFDYCYFACNEILKKATAERYQAASPQTAKITRYRSDGTAIIWFYPEHPGCRFRAFETLREGAIDHLSLIHKRFNRSWPAVLAGDPALYAHMLKLQRYYTADESAYTKTLVSVFRMVSKIKVDYKALEAPKPEEKKHEGLTESQKRRILNLVALTAQQSYEDSRPEY